MEYEIVLSRKQNGMGESLRKALCPATRATMGQLSLSRFGIASADFFKKKCQFLSKNSD